MTAAEARELMLDWAEGRRSHANFFRGLNHGSMSTGDQAAHEAALNVSDAAEVQKWAAVAVALDAIDVVDAEVLPDAGRLREILLEFASRTSGRTVPTRETDRAVEAIIEATS